MSFKYTIKDMPEDERPRERLIKYGANALKTSELLAVIIRTGTKEKTALDLSDEIVKKGGSGVSGLIEMTSKEFESIDGIGKCKAAQIMAAIELGKRIATSKKTEGVKVTSPLDVSNLLMDEMKHFKKEYFRTIMLDTKNKVMDIEDVSIGSLSSSIVHPREVFKNAIRNSCASIILVHNHPSGDPTPSREDISITRRLVESGEIIGIKVLDHIVIGNDRYFSLKEKNKM